VEGRFGDFNEDWQKRLEKKMRGTKKNATVKKSWWGAGPKKRKNTRKPKRRKNAKGTKKKGKPTKSYKKIGVKGGRKRIFQLY